MSSRFLLAATSLLLTASVALAQPAPSGTVPSGAAPSGAADAPKPVTGAPAPRAASPQVDPASQAIAEAIKRMNANDVNGAMAKLTEAIKINPKSSAAYVLRASVYCQKKQWTEAEADFKAAQALAPTNIVIKMNLVEIKFMQKQYDAARAGYVALGKDPDMGDLIAYKIFLCDLLAGHEDVATKELAAFNKAGENPSYYFSNAAWYLVHKDNDQAQEWLLRASNIYAARKFTTYAQSLRDLGYLPLPPPKKKEQ